MKIKNLLIPMLAMSGMLLASCASQPTETNVMNEPTSIYQVHTIENKQGLKMQVTNLGAKVMKLMVPDQNGELVDVVLGFDTPEEFAASSESYFGATIGRYGNRIANAKFELDGNTYTLAANNGPNSLHGGPGGFHNVIWEVVEVTDNQIVFSYLSEDGEEGFPGNLKVTMTYTLTEDNEFKITYEATTDKATVVNLTHHSFFNLSGAGNGDILDHVLMLNADQFTPVNKDLIPTGELKSVKGTPMDFTSATAIGDRIDADFEQLKHGGGYDHNWVLNKDTGSELTLAAKISAPKTGIAMEVWTTEPGIQFYAGNFLNGKVTGKEGKTYPYRGAFCLETQHFPDSPNQPNFPSVRLDPEQEYSHTCIYKFGISEK
jgi:aldose 1-epimerase